MDPWFEWEVEFECFVSVAFFLLFFRRSFSKFLCGQWFGRMQKFLVHNVLSLTHLVVKPLSPGHSLIEWMLFICVFKQLQHYWCEAIPQISQTEKIVIDYCDDEIINWNPKISIEPMHSSINLTFFASIRIILHRAKKTRAWGYGQAAINDRQLLLLSLLMLNWSIPLKLTKFLECRLIGND